jgi:hypothetical protein
VHEHAPHNAYHVLVREWNPQTWELGPLFEVRIDKNERASNLSAFLTTHVFPHIAPDNLMCSKVSAAQIKSFRRGELLLRRWSKLRVQSVWLGQSTLEINRDSIYVVVRDSSIPVREELSEEEVRKFCT